jgi:hypothetical protein
MFPASRCRFIEAAGVLSPTHGAREERLSDKRRKKDTGALAKSFQWQTLQPKKTNSVIKNKFFFLLKKGSESGKRGGISFIF